MAWPWRARMQGEHPLSLLADDGSHEFQVSVYLHLPLRHYAIDLS